MGIAVLVLTSHLGERPGCSVSDEDWVVAEALCSKYAMGDSSINVPRERRRA